MLFSGEPLSEKQLRGNTSIKVLSEEEQEGVRVAGRVSCYRNSYVATLVHLNLFITRFVITLSWI